MLPADPVVLVIGATGYVGAHTVLAAATHSHVQRVIAQVRPESAGRPRLERMIEGVPKEVADRIRLETCDLEPRQVDDLLGRVGPTHIFLCHGTTAKGARREGTPDPYEVVDVGITRTLVEAAARQEGDPGLGPRIVYLGSMGTSKSARGAYLQARWRSEELLRKSGLPYTICRAPLITGPDRPQPRTGETWARRALDPLLGLLGTLGLRRLRGRYTSMDGEEA
ncbi:MAG: NAD-dependent epimerase/dehydratase family protein, partial [Planctomycetota bacterium]